MGKIVAIGGGETGHHEGKYNTAEIDREIMSLTDKKNPNFLFIGIANKHPDSYYKNMSRIYGGLYGCATDELTLKDLGYTETTRRKILEWADIIYVGGGNTLKLMTLLRRFGTDKLLCEAYEAGKVLCGISAGGICWCEYGVSDSRTYKEPERKYVKVKGLGLLNIIFAPHATEQPERITALERMMKRFPHRPGIAVDFAALEVVDGKYRTIKIADQASCVEEHIIKRGKYLSEDISTEEFKDIPWN